MKVSYKLLGIIQNVKKAKLTKLDQYAKLGFLLNLSGVIRNTSNRRNQKTHFIYSNNYFFE